MSRAIADAIRAKLNPNPADISDVMGDITKLLDKSITGTTIDDQGQAVRLLEVNVDDATGEVLAHTVSQLLAAGAHDAWITPIIMKKGRPAHTVHVLCDESRAGELASLLVRETGSLGVRASSMRRWPHARRDITVDIDGHPIRVKIAEHRVKV